MKRKHFCNCGMTPQELDECTSFAELKRTADLHWERISSGSGRIVYDLGDGKVLKVARNEKGRQQNLVEIDTMPYLHERGYGVEIHDYSAHGYWIVCDKVDKKVTKGELKKFLGDIYEFAQVGINMRQRRNGYPDIDEVNWNLLTEDAKQILELCEELDLLVGDYLRPSNFGWKDGKIVIVDAGFNHYVMEHYYYDTF